MKENVIASGTKIGILMLFMVFPPFVSDKMYVLINSDRVLNPVRVLEFGHYSNFYTYVILFT